MTVELRPLTPADFERRRTRLIAAFADDLAKSSGLSSDQARADADRRVSRLLPAGADTPGQLLRAAGEDGVEVGLLWIVTASQSLPDMALIAVIEVHPEA